MHYALEIPEIVANIFGHCHNHRASLASLARTYSTFKEPALNVLWEELDDLFALVKCLPEAFYRVSVNKYALSRPLTQNEWDIIRSYTRRTRSIKDYSSDMLNIESLIILSGPPTAEPLFPNLISALFFVWNSREVKHSLGWFPKVAPNVRNITIEDAPYDLALNELVSSCICRWTNLQTLICPQVALNMDALAHLSCLPAFTKLDFVLGTVLPFSDSPLFFPDLRTITICSIYWELLSKFFSRARVPTLTELLVIIESCPSKPDLSFLADIRTSTACYGLKDLSLVQYSASSSISGREDSPLGWYDLQLCTGFRHLHCLKLEIEWRVALDDADLFALVSAWPNLQMLVINEECGWNGQGGVTPYGLLRLLQMCPSLKRVALAMDTRGFTEHSSNDFLANSGQILPCTFSLNVLDSAIDAASVRAVAAFFAGIFSCPHVTLVRWAGADMVEPPGWKVYRECWRDVCKRAREVASRHHDHIPCGRPLNDDKKSSGL